MKRVEAHSRVDCLQTREGVASTCPRGVEMVPMAGACGRNLHQERNNRLFRWGSFFFFLFCCCFHGALKNISPVTDPDAFSVQLEIFLRSSS
jgi:hypothetical protein